MDKKEARRRLQTIDRMIDVLFDMQSVIRRIVEAEHNNDKFWSSDSPTTEFQALRSFT